MKVIEWKGPTLESVVDGLRALADAIETGSEEVHNVAYVIDKGNGSVSVGLLGVAPVPAETAYFLMAAGKKKLLTGIGE